MAHKIVVLKEDRVCDNLDCCERMAMGDHALRLQAFRWDEKRRNDVRCVVFYCASCAEDLFPGEDWE